MGRRENRLWRPRGRPSSAARHGTAPTPVARGSPLPPSPRKTDRKLPRERATDTAPARRTAPGVCSPSGFPRRLPPTHFLPPLASRLSPGSWLPIRTRPGSARDPPPRQAQAGGDRLHHPQVPVSRRFPPEIVLWDRRTPFLHSRPPAGPASERAQAPCCERGELPCLPACGPRSSILVVGPVGRRPPPPALMCLLL